MLYNFWNMGNPNLFERRYNSWDEQDKRQNIDGFLQEKLQWVRNGVTPFLQ